MKFLNLLKIKMPIGAIVSILHRVSGVILIITMPVLIYLFGMSLINSQGFFTAKQIITNFNIFHVLVIWAISHHVLCGIRFLLIDVEIGVSKSQANISSIIVVILSVILFLTSMINLM